MDAVVKLPLHTSKEQGKFSLRDFIVKMCSDTILDYTSTINEMPKQYDRKWGLCSRNCGEPKTNT